MAYLVLIIATTLLTGGFVWLVEYETRTGVRYAAARRAHLDSTVERLQFLVTHVDLLSLLREWVGHVASRMWHQTIELSLHAVRAVERFLTRIVRSFRSRQPTEIRQSENAREFVKQLTEFKEQLQGPPPESQGLQ